MRFLLAIIITFTFISCSHKPSVEDLKWLQGSWSGTGSDGTLFREMWTQESDKLFTGRGVALNAGDTVFQEAFKLQEVEGVPYYVTKVPDNPEPVLFKLSFMKNDSAVFENQEHEFPQRIIYALQHDGVLHIRLDGSKQGLRMNEEIFMRREK